MAYFQEISFFHGCGHSENHVWSPDNTTPPASTREPLPIIDRTFHHVLEEDNTEQVTEAHYRKGLCSSCQTQGSQSVPDAFLHRTESESLENNHEFWQDIISQCTLPLHQLQQAVVSAQELQDEIVAEYLQQQNRLKEIDRMFSENASQRSNNASQAWRALSSSSVVYHSRIDEDARRLQVLNGLSDIQKTFKPAMDNLEQVRLRYQFFKNFSLLCWVQDMIGGVSREAKFHSSVPGFDNGLFTVETAPSREQDEPAENCSICLLDLHRPGRVRSLPCGHYWHRGCISSWLTDNKTCPICRARYNIIKLPQNDIRLMSAAVNMIQQELFKQQAQLRRDKQAQFLKRNQDLSAVNYFRFR